MTDFKQIIGRGTRVRDDYGKLFFNILDYTGTATRMFADPDFDGEPVSTTEGPIEEPPEVLPDEPPGTEPGEGPLVTPEEPGVRRKFYFDGGQVEIAAHLVYELDPDGRQLRVVKFTDYTAEKVRTLFTSASDLRRQWADPAQRAAVIERLAERGIDFDELAASASQPEADPFDLLCHVAFNAPLRTRCERAERLWKEKNHFLNHNAPEARGPRRAAR